ncbi:serine hydrolase [Altererythrobacter sp.]|nr:serine hydrolase [Altererythrobacter sp.]
MIRTIQAAATALLLTAVPAAAQSEQEQLNTRYDRALAAGYKALMLCSAIGNADATGVLGRTAESVHEWELTGIQAPLDGIIRELPYEVVLKGEGREETVNRVEVTWADDAPPRFAKYLPGSGCISFPIGMEPSEGDATVRPEYDVPKVLLGPALKFPTNPVIDAAFDGTYGEGSRTTVVVVRKNGKAVDWNWLPDFSLFTPQRTWSVAKSIAATVVGAAVHRGEASVEDSAGLGLDDTDPRRAITIDHALRMASGRYSDTPGNRTDPLYWGGTTVAERAQDWPLIHKPGTVYRYANNDTLAAIKAIEGTFEAHPPRAVLDALSMDHTTPETDWQGNYVLSSQVWATAHDLSLLGQLYLDDGVARDGTRILPEGWVEYVSSPSGPQPEGRNIGYGAGFWLFDQNEGIPADTFAAMGNRGQYVVIVPSRDVVIVRRGEDPAGKRFDILGFTRDILAALEE